MLTAASLTALWAKCRGEWCKSFAIIILLARVAQMRRKQGRNGEVNSAVSDGKTLRVQ
jgi:hypothetical protein